MTALLLFYGCDQYLVRLGIFTKTQKRQLGSYATIRAGIHLQRVHKLLFQLLSDTIGQIKLDASLNYCLFVCI